jgi:ketol-acid reductoisomerase
MACFECLHELRLIVDLIYEAGPGNMNYGISNNAEFRRVPERTAYRQYANKRAMKEILNDIQTGEYAKSLVLESKAAAPTLQSLRRLNSEHQIGVVGAKLRAMMPWIPRNQLLDRSKN